MTDRSKSPVHPGSEAPDRRLMMTAYGWDDGDAADTMPRHAAKELARRGWEVTVFYAATGPGESDTPYEVIESEADGVRLLGVHNRAHGLLDLGNPLRELDDPPITAAFAAALDRLRPRVVHFHDLHNLGAALIDQTAARGLPAFLSTDDHWLICPRANLLTGNGETCPGPGDGGGCASCVHSPEIEAHRVRLRGIRARVSRSVSACLAVSEAVHRTLLATGYPAELLDLVKQGAPADGELGGEQPGHGRSQVRAPRRQRLSDYVDELEAYYAGERPGRVAEQPPVEELAVRWQGDHGLSTSLSIVNARAVEQLPTRVQRVASDGSPLDPPLAHAADVEIRHQWPPDLRAPPAGRLVVIQPWEFGAIPREWIPALREHVDELWAPSEIVRAMYLGAGLDPERVVTLPYGVDLERFSPQGDCYALPREYAQPADSHADETGSARVGARRFLFVGGLIARKGPDVLLRAWQSAFAGREDVLLVVKDFGAKGVYKGGDREAIIAHARSGAIPRVLLIDDQLDEREIAALYRACDVLVHPYRGEGFAMPVLEAMACATPVIVTAGGPTDEFCPPTAGWRIRSVRTEMQVERVGPYDTAGRPWLLEPDADHLAELLRFAATAEPEELASRGAAGRAAAERYGWDRVVAGYTQRIATVAARPRIGPPAKPRKWEEDVELRLLATPAWRGEDRLRELLQQWRAGTDPTTSACLYLLADPLVDGSQEELERHVLDTGVELEQAADVTVLLDRDAPGRDRDLHASIDAFVPVHGACHGHRRLAAAAGRPTVSLGRELERFLSAHMVC